MFIAHSHFKGSSYSDTIVRWVFIIIIIIIIIIVAGIVAF
jgi:hypothetical protein